MFLKPRSKKERKSEVKGRKERERERESWERNQPISDRGRNSTSVTHFRSPPRSLGSPVMFSSVRSSLTRSARPLRQQARQASSSSSSSSASSSAAQSAEQATQKAQQAADKAKDMAGQASQRASQLFGTAQQAVGNALGCKSTHSLCD
jgi:hypothetical protein